MLTECRSSVKQVVNRLLIENRLRISIKGIVRHSTVAAVSTHHDLAMLSQIPSSCLTADPVTCTSGQSPGEHSIKEWVSSDMISEEVENSSEPIAPRLSCSTDKSIVNTRNRGNCDKKTDLNYSQNVFGDLSKLQ